MFGSQILDVAIGMAFVYMVLSLICSAVNEWIASRLNMRAGCLEKAIKNLFTDVEKKDIAKLFYEHPLIKGLMDGNKLPSYIPPKTFAAAVLDLMEKAKSSASEEYKVFTLLKDNNLKDLLTNFSTMAKTNIEQARLEIETWFNGAMERVSGWYKRKIPWIILGIAFGVSGFLNADSFTIANALWSNGNLRAAVVASAQVAANNPLPSGPNASSKSIEDLRSELQSLNLPIGWVQQQDQSNTAEKKPLLDDPRAMPHSIGGWIYKIVGIIFTAIAASQGAPFWFDLLNRFIDLRGVGKKPEEKKDKKENGSASKTPAGQ